MRLLSSFRFFFEKNLKRLVRVSVRFVVVWGIEALSLLVLHWAVSGIVFIAPNEVGLAAAALSTALVLALLNTLVRPLIVWLTVPLNVYTAGFFTFLINAGMLVLASFLLPYLEVSGWGAAVVGALVLAVVNTVLTSLTTIDDDYSFFDGVVQWLSRREVGGKVEQTRGIVVIEIDGLSFERLAEALERGLMPKLGALLSMGGHRLSPFFCGLPSQTSSSQAAIMYGHAFDIPAFRWYEKERGVFMVSNRPRDALEMDRRLSTGDGLLRGGTSINNQISGDARKALITMSAISMDNDLPMRRWLGDLNLFFVNPYLFPRVIALMVGDILRELLQGARQLVLNRRPRLNRLGIWPFERAVTNVYFREMTTFLVISDVMRGSPAIYASYAGYDEVAHHAGPASSDALGTLRGLDRQLGRILDVMGRKAPRPYDFVVLSDHGQSEGATFRQRYGYSLAEFLDRITARRILVADSVYAVEGGRAQVRGVSALLAELGTVSETVSREPVDTMRERRARLRAVVYGRTQRGLSESLAEREAASAPRSAGATPGVESGGRPSADSVPGTAPDVVVCAGGNMAHAYFPGLPGRATLAQIEEAHPGCAEALIAHPGIGFIVGLTGGGEPVAVGKGGARNLVNGRVSGADPLEAYGKEHHVARQLLRLAGYPHSGDLIINSTLFPDGTVAAFEELIGNHGGLGGAQTNAFLLHPADMGVPILTDAAELFPLLDARRGLPAPPPPGPAAEPEVDAWSWTNLAAGVRDAGTWIGRALRVLTLRPRVFREVADDVRTTGPALLILSATVVSTGLTNGLDSSVEGSFGAKVAAALWADVAGWTVMVLLAYFAAGLLHGRGSFTRTFRAMAYARVPLFLLPLQLVPSVGSPIAAASLVLFLVASLIALREAMRLRWVLAVFIPIISVAVLVVGAAMVGEVFTGVQITIEALLHRLGLVPGR